MNCLYRHHDEESSGSEVTPAMDDPPPIAGGQWLPRVARWALEDALLRCQETRAVPMDPYLHQQRGVFVTIRTRQGELRGCRGSIECSAPNLVEETRAMTMSSAFRDGRFEPVRASELDELTFEVSVLHSPEPVTGPEELDPARYGVILRTPDGRQALMLPGVEGLDTVEKQLSVTRRKGSIDPDEPIQILRFRVDKFVE